MIRFVAAVRSCRLSAVSRHPMVGSTPFAIRTGTTTLVRVTTTVDGLGVVGLRAVAAVLMAAVQEVAEALVAGAGEGPSSAHPHHESHAQIPRVEERAQGSAVAARAQALVDLR